MNSLSIKIDQIAFVFPKKVILPHFGTLKVKIAPNKGIFNTFFSSFFHSISNFLIQPTENTIFNTCIITIIIYRNRAFHWYPIYPITVKIEWAMPSSNAPYIPFDVQVYMFLNFYPFQFIWTLSDCSLLILSYLCQIVANGISY